MPTKPKTKGTPCVDCAKSFYTAQALAQHSLAKGHGASRCCKPCGRFFGSLDALESHRKQSKFHQRSPEALRDLSSQARPKSSFHNTPKASNDNTKSPSSLHSEPSQSVHSAEMVLPVLVFRGNTYSQISGDRHQQVLEALRSRCHPASTLQRHGYNFRETFVGTSNGVSTLPKTTHSSRTRKAVVIDCEMVGTGGGKSEVISLAAVDFLTGEQLVHSLVKPHQPILDWRTKIHGISPAMMAVARAQNLTLDGWQGARAELFKHVDENTILIGQSLDRDLAPLRIQHDKIVDSAILASDTVFGSTGKPRYWRLGLQTLCQELVGLEIRGGASPRSVSATHDGREDALATREVVLWCLQNEAAFRAWAIQKREAYQKQPPRNRGKRNQGQKARAKYSAPPRQYEESEYSAATHWEDVVPWEVWPKSPPDWD